MFLLQLAVVGLLAPAGDDFVRSTKKGIALRTVRGIEFLHEGGTHNWTFAIPERPGLRGWPGPISPDGQFLPVAHGKRGDPLDRYRVTAYPLDGGRPVELGGEVPVDHFVWHGRTLIGERSQYEGLGPPGHYRHTQFDLVRRTATDLGIDPRPGMERDPQFREAYPQSRLGVPAATPDGKWFVATNREWSHAGGELFLASTDGKVVQPLTPPGLWVARKAAVSPDGKTVLVTLVEDRRPRAAPMPLGLYRVELANGRMTRLRGFDEPDPSMRYFGGAFEFAWRPDGKRVAVKRSGCVDPVWWPEVWTQELFTCDPDGGNRRDVIERDVCRGSNGFELMGWR